MDWTMVLALVQSPVLVGVVTWAVMVHSDVKVLKSQRDDQKNQRDDLLKIMDLKFEVISTKLDSIGERVKRVETHVLNGHGKES